MWDRRLMASPSDAYKGNKSARVEEVIQDAVFTCNTRQMYDAFHMTTDVHMPVYYFGDLRKYNKPNHAAHATDLDFLYYTRYKKLGARGNSALAYTMSRVCRKWMPT
jgi:carboxylesterase type B